MSKALDILKSCKNFIFNGRLFRSRLDSQNVLHYEPIDVNSDFTVEIGNADTDGSVLVLFMLGSSRVEDITPVRVEYPFSLRENEILSKEKAIGILRSCNCYVTGSTLKYYSISEDDMLIIPSIGELTLNHMAIHNGKILLAGNYITPIKVTNILK